MRMGFGPTRPDRCPKIMAARTSATDERVIARLRRNRHDEIRVAVSRVHTIDLVDVRIFIERSPGRWWPTTKGVNLRAHDLTRLIEALQAALEAAPTVRANAIAERPPQWWQR